MRLPVVASLSNSYIANTIAKTVQMLVKSTRSHPYFGFCHIYLATVGIKSCNICIVLRSYDVR